MEKEWSWLSKEIIDLRNEEIEFVTVSESGEYDIHFKDKVFLLTTKQYIVIIGHDDLDDGEEDY